MCLVYTWEIKNRSGVGYKVLKRLHFGLYDFPLYYPKYQEYTLKVGTIIHDTFHKQLVIQSNDPQCLDEYYPSGFHIFLDQRDAYFWIKTGVCRNMDVVIARARYDDVVAEGGQFINKVSGGCVVARTMEILEII
jgi:hypothetical protein